MADDLATILQAAQDGRFNTRLDQPPHQPWTWTKDYPGVAKALGDTLQYGPMALGARAFTGPRDAVISRMKEHKALHDPGPYDWGITGGNPDAVGAYLARGEGRNPVAIYERSSSDLASRPGVRSTADGPFDPVYSSAMAEDFMAAPRVGGANARDRLSGEKPYWSQRAPDNSNAPRIPELTNPAAGRMSQALDNGGKPATVELSTSPDLVARYLAALTGKGRQPPNLSVIEGGYGLFPKKD